MKAEACSIASRGLKNSPQLSVCAVVDASQYVDNGKGVHRYSVRTVYIA
jgi:hypothetical protein